MNSCVYQKFATSLTKALTSRGWNISYREDGPVKWQMFLHPINEVPTSGWKVHVTIGTVEKVTNLGKIADLLLAMQCSFKIAADRASLHALNDGLGGKTQIGKCVTIYCASKDEATILAQDFGLALTEGCGPLIFGEFVPWTDSRASIRYGSNHYQIDWDEFGRPERWHRGAEIEPQGIDLVSINGQSVDTMPPKGFFVRRHCGLDQKSPINFQGNAFVPITSIGLYPKEVYRAVEISSGLEVIIKRAWKGTFVDLSGDQRDRCDRLKDEYLLLKELSKKGVIGYEPIACIEDSQSTTLITTAVSGQALNYKKAEPSSALWFAILNAIDKIHRANIVHQDIKASNIIWDGKSAQMIDFEIAAPKGQLGNHNLGTRNYYCVSDPKNMVLDSRDIFAFGSLFIGLFLKFDVAQIQISAEKLEHLLMLAEVPDLLIKILLQCRHADPEKRPKLFQLQAFEHDWSKLPRGGCKYSQFNVDATSEQAYSTRSFQERVGNLIRFRNVHLYKQHAMEGINLGGSGIILGLMTLDEACNTEHFEQDVRLAARYLAEAPMPKRSAGLFTGNAGVAIALAVASGRYNDQFLLVDGKKRFAFACENVVENDLFSGRAGVILAGLILSEIFSDPWYLEKVGDLLATLVGELVKSHGVIGVRSSGRLDGEMGVLTGAAHGSAGIALVLGRAGRLLNESSLTDLSLAIFKSLFKHAYHDGFNLDRVAGRPDKPAPKNAWCHGAMGLLWSLLQAELPKDCFDIELSTLVAGFLSSIKLNNPTYCHGLSGSLEVLRMLGNHEKFAVNSIEKQKLVVEWLWCQSQIHPLGSVWGAEDPNVITPDLWVGFMGPITAIALWQNNQVLPLISGGWLGQCARQKPKPPIPRDY